MYIPERNKYANLVLQIRGVLRDSEPPWGEYGFASYTAVSLWPRSIKHLYFALPFDIGPVIPLSTESKFSSPLTTHGATSGVFWPAPIRDNFSFCRSLIWEDGSAIYLYNYYWALPTLYLSGPSRIEFVTKFYCLIWDWIHYLSTLTTRS